MIPEIKKDYSLKEVNTFGIAATAKYFVSFKTVDELKTIVSSSIYQENEHLILGGGSNVLLRSNFDGLVLKNELKGIEVEDFSDHQTILKSQSGEIWHQVVLFAISKNFGGIENLSLIPGSIGAAPMQNIGAYGVELKDVFYELEALNLATLKIEKFNAKACEFGYRESVFKREKKGQYIITSVSLKLSKKEHQLNTSYGAINSELLARGVISPTIKDVSDAVISIRQSKLPDPKLIGNAGSFFKNPVVNREVLESIMEQYHEVPNYPASNNRVKLAAGWLIEKAGWKGKKMGNYGVHENQALVLVNYGGAKGEDIYSLSRKIVEDVKAKFGVELEREVNII